MKRAAYVLVSACALAASLELAYRQAWARRCDSRPADAFIIYAIGESTAAGGTYGSALAFPTLVARFFGGRISGRPVSVQILAAPAESLDPQAESLYSQYIALRRALFCARGPGAVLIHAGYHDGSLKKEPSALEAFKRRLLARSLLLGGLIHFLERTGILSYPRTMQNYEFYLRSCIELARSKGLTPILSSLLHNDRRNALLLRLAEEYRIPWVDVAAEFERPGADLFIDGFHPNVRGQLFLAHAFSRAISRVENEPIRSPILFSEDIFFELGYPRRAQVSAFLAAAGWLISAAAGKAPDERLDLAQRRIREALSLDPENVRAWVALGMIELARRGFLLKNEHVAWLKQHVVSYGEFYDVQPSVAPQILHVLKTYGAPEALTLRVRRALERERKAPERARDAAERFQAASALLLAGRLAECVAEYRRAIALDPSLAPAHANLGSALAAQGRRKEAARHYRLSLELEPGNPWIYRRLKELAHEAK